MATSMDQISSLDIVLHKSENAWKPPFKRGNAFDEKERLKRCVQATLNKLTLQKFRILLSKIEKLKFNNAEDLELFIDLIWENAVYEPHFAALYANLCKELCQIPLCLVDGFGNQAYFQDGLLIKCMKEFDNWCIGLSGQRILSSSEDENRKLKCQQIGIIRFIGELFNFQVVRSSILHECISKLMNMQDNMSLEFACELFKTAGKELDESELNREDNFNGENLVDVYFAQLQVLVNEHFTNRRIRFMLQDVIELRLNYWVPRRIRLIPRTIEEIHNESVLKISRSD